MAAESSPVEREQKRRLEKERCSCGGKLKWLSLSKAECSVCGTKYVEYWSHIWVKDSHPRIKEG
jgi:hypothetical protein